MRRVTSRTTVGVPFVRELRFLLIRITAAKAATVHLTKMMSAEFQKAGIRVNSIAPGYFPSEMTDKNQTSDENQKSEFPQKKIEDTGHVPEMRPGREEEMGMAMLFFAKNGYVNGQILSIDGGVLNVVGS